VTKTAIEPMLGFITKVTAVRVASSNNPAIARPLREQVRCGARLSECRALPAPPAPQPPPCRACERPLGPKNPRRPQPPPNPQAFAAPEKLVDVVTKVNDAMAGPVPAAAAKACLYLTNPATRAILFRWGGRGVCGRLREGGPGPHRGGRSRAAIPRPADAALAF
jgi:hypothetical protein